MKGFLDTTKGTLYIFPQEAGAIPYVDPEVTKIAVQPDEVIAFKEANELYADMIYPYNYWTMTVKAKVWAGHEDDDIEVPVTPLIDPDLQWSADEATVTIGADDNIFPTLTNEYQVNVTYSSSDETAATIAADGTVTLVAAGTTTITASFAGDETYDADEVSYELTVNEAATTYSVGVNGGENLASYSALEGLSEGDTFYFSLIDQTVIYSAYGATSGDPITIETSDNQDYDLMFTMPAENVVLDLVYNYPEPTEEVEVPYTQWDGGTETHTRYIDETDIGKRAWYDAYSFTNYISYMSVGVDGTEYQMSTSNLADDIYWDDLTDKNAGVKYNADTVFPDIYVKTSLSPQTVSLTYTPSQL